MGRLNKQLLRLLWIGFLFVENAFASSGDYLPQFRECAAECRNLYRCPESSTAYGWTREKCFLCRQDCIWKTVSAFQTSGLSVPQFFGKWPFVPMTLKVRSMFFLVQEPASTIFSLLNLYGMFGMLRRIQKDVPRRHPCFILWNWFCYGSIFAWTCSAIFHSCDFQLTEYMDYFSACAMITVSFYVSLCFTLPMLQTSKKGYWLRRIIALSLALFYIHHIRYLTTSQYGFDYAYNMKCCIALSAATSVLYILWTLKEVYCGRGRQSFLLLFSAIGVGWLAAIFELFDFPPLFWVFDAHSLFHLFTVPVPFFWSKFVSAEITYELSSSNLPSIAINKRNKII